MTDILVQKHMSAAHAVVRQSPHLQEATLTHVGNRHTRLNGHLQDRQSGKQHASRRSSFLPLPTPQHPATKDTCHFKGLAGTG
jgi:hypothetical protein